MDVPGIYATAPDFRVIGGIAGGVVAMLLLIAFVTWIVIHRGKKDNAHSANRNDIGMQRAAVQPSARPSADYARLSVAKPSDHYDDPGLLANNEYGLVKASSPQTPYDAGSVLHDRPPGTEYDSSAL